MKCPWFSLGSACSFGLHIYCIIKIQVTAHLHRVPERRVSYRAARHIKEALACWTCSPRGQLSKLTGLHMLQSQQPRARTPGPSQATLVDKADVTLCDKRATTNDQLRKESMSKLWSAHVPGLEEPCDMSLPLLGDRFFHLPHLEAGSTRSVHCPPMRTPSSPG